MKAVHAHERALLDVLEPALRAMPGVTVHSNARSRTPTLLFTVAGRDPQEIRGLLAERGVNAPAGHFYAIECSRHLGLGDGGGVRVGLAPYTSADDIDRLAHRARPRSSERERIPLMAQHDHDPVLVTGCSTGIGRAVVEDLLLQGHTVWATARRPDTLADLADRGAHVTALDVTDEASMSAAVAEVEATHGSVGTLVNNAGYGEYGAVEEVDMDKVRAMFETNVFGLARMCQLVLPGMRRAGKGRIINIGSMGGRFTFPLGGYYHATKYAVEALTDALRMEVTAFGVDVALVEPGITRSSFVEKIHRVRRDGR